MSKLSRWMPEAPPKRVIPMHHSFLAVLVILLLCFAFSMKALVVVAGFVLVAIVLAVYDHLRLRRLAERRLGESICTFARSFDRRRTDPWVIRAVYEELNEYFAGRLPVRAGDRIEEDLHMDWEDVDDLLKDVAARVGRSLDQTGSNPFYGQIKNVGDLVLFLTYQPKCSGA